jgi:GxxExxY protein
LSTKWGKQAIRKADARKDTKDSKLTSEILYKEESYKIQGAVFEVYREMGCGFLEAVYQECAAKEFLKQGIIFSEQPELKIYYKGELLQHTYKPDFICYEAIIVELKALTTTTSEHKAQILNYMKATGMHLGLLINFGCYPKATIERIVL